MATNKMSADQKTYRIRVSPEPFYLSDHSAPELNRYAFGYRITIHNEGRMPARLLTRHWIITDANGKIQEVRGDGVVGEQPHLQPGEAFQYTSWAVIETAVGNMRGSYQMIADDGTQFAAEIPAFTLAMPRTLH
ncbi:MAG: Co2+/Mg2+ efflux protein ApaG [Gammaproteobacteria bacterium]